MTLNYRARLIDYPKWFRYSLRPISAAKIGKMRRESKRKREAKLAEMISQGWLRTSDDA